ncbi:MAG: thioredoxin-disulfide reductase [Alphaproteobacteria bacterium]|nr:thioredoxin-disulfide reductase [Alphaproteobacteria bacterium]
MSTENIKKEIRTKVLIIGSGPAGYTAAIYAARANLKPVQVLGLEPGGQLMITTEVENYPGFADLIQGPWLMEQMKGQAANVGTEMIHDLITDIDLSKRPFVCKGDDGATYIADTVIISTGAKARWLGLPAEEKFRGLGVSACATCDGFFFRGKDVAIVGGGNSAVEEALFLTNFASKVTLIHRRDTLRAEKIMQERLFKNEKIECLWDTAVTDIIGVAHGEEGTPGVTGVKLKNLKTNEESTLDVDGIFVAIGHDPATELFKGQLKMDEAGYIITTPDSTLTSIDGVYAAGDVKDKVYRQAVTAAGMGCMAALEADRFLSEQEDLIAEHAAE